MEIFAAGFVPPSSRMVPRRAYMKMLRVSSDTTVLILTWSVCSKPKFAAKDRAASRATTMSASRSIRSSTGSIGVGSARSTSAISSA
jgi:hypothetical protein